MKKFIKHSLLLLCSLILIGGLTACNNGGKDEPTPTPKAKYMVVYTMTTSKDLLRFADVKLTLKNPSTGKTEVRTITEQSASDYDKHISVLNEKLFFFDPTKGFVAFIPTDEVKDGMEYFATVDVIPNQEKITKIPSGKYTFARPSISAWLLKEVDGKAEVISFESSTSFSTFDKPTFEQALNRITQAKIEGKIDI